VEKSNGYGQYYHQMNFTRDELGYIANGLLDTYNDDRLNDYDYAILNIIDRIEKELGVE
jgi:hypothetical protein